ncbi:hypothetical protein N9L47_03310 [Rhodobacteraceae bacterium]|nr:hypothetical protein [Paracoccaceae bacterium]
MLTNKIIDAVFDSIFQNFRNALAISVPPFIIAIVVFVGLNFQSLRNLAASNTGYITVDSAQIVGFVVGILCLVYAGTYVAVRWHCFSLDVPKVLQKNYIRPFLYLVMSALFVLLIMVILIVVLILPSTLLLGEVQVEVGSFASALARGWPHVLVNAIGTFAFAYLFLTLASVSLVGHAVGKGTRDPRRTTHRVRREILQIATIYTVATFMWTFVGFVPLPLPIALAVQLAFVWLAFMISIAFLTEIYREVMLEGV